MEFFGLIGVIWLFLLYSLQLIMAMILCSGTQKVAEDYPYLNQHFQLINIIIQFVTQSSPFYRFLWKSRVSNLVDGSRRQYSSALCSQSTIYSFSILSVSNLKQFLDTQSMFSKLSSESFPWHFSSSPTELYFSDRIFRDTAQDIYLEIFMATLDLEDLSILRLLCIQIFLQLTKKLRRILSTALPKNKYISIFRVFTTTKMLISF